MFPLLLFSLSSGILLLFLLLLRLPQFKRHLLDRIHPFLTSIIFLFLMKFGIDKFMIYIYNCVKNTYKVWKILCDISGILFTCTLIIRPPERETFSFSKKRKLSGWFTEHVSKLRIINPFRIKSSFRVLQNIPGTSIVSRSTMAAFPPLLFKEEELSRSAS